jgi:hypothetical protein
MSDIPLRARSATEIIDAAFQLMRQRGLQFILVSALAYAPWLVIQLIFLRGTLTATPGTTPQIADFVLSSIGSFIVYSLMTGAIMKLASRIYLGGAPGEIGDALRDVMPRVPAIIGGTFLRTLIVMLAALPMLLAFIHPLFAVVGVISFIVGGMYLFASYLPVTAIIVLEDRSVIDSLTRSAALTRNRKRHILATYILMLLILSVLSVGIVMLMTLLGAGVWGAIAMSIFTVVIYPVVSLIEMLIYYDLRIRNEGYDIEVMAGALEAPGTVSP